ncbi:MAG TPA: SCO family protein [Sphingomicrobium sp.]
MRLLLWLLIALAIAGSAALLLIRRGTVNPPQASGGAHFGGAFTLVGADGKPFSSEKLLGKPYALYFGFTRCGDVCPTTLQRLVKLRQAAGGEDRFSIVFITIDPAFDGPKQVGQYAGLFNSPIVGLTGSAAQIAQVKKQYGIYAQPQPHAKAGEEMMHTATVLLFDRGGNLVGTITPDEPDSSALETLKQLTSV